MITSLNGFKLIQKFEGCRLQAYLCPAGVWTIGYGSTKGVKKGMKITKDEALIFLVRDVIYFENRLHFLPSQINQNQYDAIVSLTFNIGIHAFKSSTLVEKLLQRKFRQAANQFPRWKFAKGKVLKGLIRRREAEKTLFLKK